jgi:OOP family OmpA-OmpF porin
MFRHPIATATCLLAAATVRAAGGDVPVKPLPAASAASSAFSPHISSLPARGLFQGDQLTDSARQRLTELILDAIGLQVDVALIVPTGPWNLDGSGKDERDLTPARLEAVKRFLTQRGVAPHRIYVESRIDAKLKEPRLDVQIVGRPAVD